MFEQRRLGDLISEHIHFRPISSGWVVGKCGLCNDYKERAGFKFDGNDVIYNCWNCSTKCRAEEFAGHISRKFRHVLNCFGIEDSEIDAVLSSAFFMKDNEAKKITLETLTKVKTTTPTVKLPPGAIRLGSTEEHLDEQVKLIQYLEKRCIDLDRYQFYFSMEPRFKDRVIIPFYRQNALIYWQARSINPLEKKRYDNAVVGRDAVMFNFNQLSHFSPLPLFVCEGVFDAMMFDGVALLGSSLTNAKTVLLHQTQRRLVFVIDKDANGRHLAEDVLSKGWEITFTPSGTTDLNQSVQRFGRAWTAQQIMANIPKSVDAARLSINLNCK